MLYRTLKSIASCSCNNVMSMKINRKVSFMQYNSVFLEDNIPCTAY